MPDPEQMLSSWKEIAFYLKRTPRSCQRLEREMGLPVHRLDGSPKAHVFAYRYELDAWLSELGHEREKKRKRRRLLYASGAAVVVIAVTAILTMVLGRRGASPELANVPHTKTVIVLPFDDLSPDKGAEYLANGIPEAVHDALARIRGLRMKGRTSAAAVKAQNLDVRKIAEQLEVEDVVSGTVQLAGDKLRVTVALESAENGLQLWSGTFDRKMGDIFEIQDGIAKSIVEKLGVTLLAGEKSALLERPTQNKEAYEFYLRGCNLVRRPRLGAPDEALAFFEKALHRDPDFALAYAGVALAYINMQTQFQKPPVEVFPKAGSAIARALTLDPDLAEGYTLDAWVKFQYEWNWEAAEKSYLRALELTPGDALTRGMYAIYLLSRRRFEEARAEIQLALTADPFMPLLNAYSMWIHMSSGRPDEVLKEFDMVQKIAPGAEFAYTGAGLADLTLGRIDEAITMFEKARRIPWNSGRAEAGLAACYVKKGDRKAAEALYGKLVEEEKKTFVSPVLLAFAAASLGKTDATIRWLETAIERRDPHLPLLNVYAATFVPDFAQSPRFGAILDKLRLPH